MSKETNRKNKGNKKSTSMMSAILQKTAEHRVNYKINSVTHKPKTVVRQETNYFDVLYTQLSQLILNNKKINSEQILELGFTTYSTANCFVKHTDGYAFYIKLNYFRDKIILRQVFDLSPTGIPDKEIIIRK